MAGFLLLFAAVRRGRTDALDLALTTSLQRRRAPWFARSMAVISWPGFPPQSWLLPSLLIVGSWWRGRRLDALFLLLAWGTAPLAALAKGQMRRPRPQLGTVRIATAALGGTSFPSGHVLSYLGVYGFLAYRVANSVCPAAVRRPLVAVLSGLLVLIGPSRIYQGHHWPTDTLASYLLGLSYLLSLTTLHRWAQARWRRM